MELNERIMKRIEVITARVYAKYHPTSIDVDDLKQECYIYILNSTSTNPLAVDAHLTKVCEGIIRSKGFSFPIKGNLTDCKIMEHTTENIECLKDTAVEYDMDLLELDSLILKSISDLTDKEKLILALRFYEDMTLDEIGYVLKITGSRVRQSEAKALRKLRYPYRSSILIGNLDYSTLIPITLGGDVFISIIENSNQDIIDRIESVKQNKTVLFSYRTPGSYAREEREAKSVEKRKKKEEELERKRIEREIWEQLPKSQLIVERSGRYELTKFEYKPTCSTPSSNIYHISPKMFKDMDHTKLYSVISIGDFHNVSIEEILYMMFQSNSFNAVKALCLYSVDHMCDNAFYKNRALFHPAAYTHIHDLQRPIYIIKHRFYCNKKIIFSDNLISLDIAFEYSSDMIYKLGCKLTYDKNKDIITLSPCLFNKNISEKDIIIQDYYSMPIVHITNPFVRYDYRDLKNLEWFKLNFCQQEILRLLKFERS